MNSVVGDKGWAKPDNALLEWIKNHRRSAVDAYRADPLLVEEHGRQEDSFRTGGYANRQLFELVQNAADAQSKSHARGRIALVLQGQTLYCANEGFGFDQHGLEAITHAYLSDKKEEEIGRFGLGFKSILGITDSPTILSRSISFGFDAIETQQILAPIAPKSRNYPILRIPHVVDANEEIANDDVLRELASWAETIIKVPVARDIERLADELKAFPAEFLLFVPKVSALTISLDYELPREYRCESLSPPMMRLLDGSGDSIDYVVLQQTHEPSDDALAEVSRAIRRPEVQVTYAARIDDAQQLGKFWAYYPLQDATSARGIHNAPWRINDDRTNLLEGKFNDELLEVLAGLIVEALPHLRTAEDPARHFDYLPARGREATYTADQRLTDIVPRRAAATACVPDGTGQLQIPSELNAAHLDLPIEGNSFRLWSSAPNPPTDWPHWTCYTTRTRRARLRTLIRADESRAAKNELSAVRWLEAITGEATDEQCDQALQVYLSISDDVARREMEAAHVVPDSTGTLWGLTDTSQLFLRGTMLSAAAGLRVVRTSFVGREHIEERLRSLNFEDVDPKHELRQLSTKAAGNWADDEWRAYWRLVEEVSAQDAEPILLEQILSGSALKVLSESGTWQKAGDVVIPGLVSPLDKSCCVDVGFHELHLGLLRALGIAERPVMTRAATMDLTYLEYLRSIRDRFRDKPSSPAPNDVNFSQGAGLAPLHILRRFAATEDIDSLCRWTRELLAIQASQSISVERRGQVLETILGPHLWAAANYGVVDSSWGPRPALKTLHPSLVEFTPLLPVATWPVAEKIPTLTTIAEVPPEIWREFLNRIPKGGDPDAIGDMLQKAFESLPRDEVPADLPAVMGESWGIVANESLLIATNDDERRVLKERGLPFVVIRNTDQAALISQAWGTELASSKLSVEIVTEGASEPVNALDRFAGLHGYQSTQLENIEVVECSSVTRVISQQDGTEHQAIDIDQLGQIIYYDSTVGDEELLGWISHKFNLGIGTMDIQRVLAATDDLRVKERVAACRLESDPALKLLTLLAPDALKACLPSGLLESVRTLDGDNGDAQLGQLLLLVHGFDVLAELRNDLEGAGYNVPRVWAGSSPAAAFVQSLGFPAEYAGERGQSLDSDFVVLGPPNLNGLHPYQRPIAREIRALVNESATPGRALLFLPTGAGKTRVTVQAIAEAFIEDGLVGPVLWIAQSEELCEQAVQTWTTVWRELGDRPLRVCRLWRDHQVGESKSETTVVVATDAKLEKIRERDDYDWVSKVAAVVVDEAHGATSPGITATLRWLGISGRHTARPLLGLTATPFRGMSEKENERLANRFGGRRFEMKCEDPYQELQRLGFLATVDHKTLPGSRGVSLSDQELKEFHDFKDIPRSVLERIGRDHDRTLRLLKHIGGLPTDWPVLVFTSSVLAAQTLSALLQVRGVSSATVSGSTKVRQRRRTLESFRDGEIQVLTNCNLLTQGFDAPSVRALYIARPTFSPNTYIQMVGRGLRGRENGGKEECLIVNVEDTFQAFGETLAFKDFDYLWREQGRKGNR
jgi:superfamily II DNA or RNA helicase